MTRKWLCLAVLVAAAVFNCMAQSVPVEQVERQLVNTKMETTSEWNHRLQELVSSAVAGAKNGPSAGDYRIGPQDELLINVLEAPDLSTAYRVSADGNISMPLLGTIRVAGLTPRELELVLQALLRRTYMKDPQVTVTVTEMKSHSVSVLGAVLKPGVFQISGTKSVLEMLSMAGGLAPDAGDKVLVMRGASSDYSPERLSRTAAKNGATDRSSRSTPASAVSSDSPGGQGTIEISLKQLLDSGDSKYNVPVYPGDIVKVKTAGIVYVVGDVNKPGGFPVKDNEHMTVLQAIALGEGIAPDADKSRAKIIRVAENGQQIELPVHLKKILSGKAPDPALQPKDILFIPKNGAKSAGKAALKTFSQWIIWHSIP